MTMPDTTARARMTLYEIDERIAACVDAETGEIIDPQALDALELARDKKIEGVACWAKEQTALASAMREEANKLLARAKAAENRVESLKGWLNTALCGEKFECARARVSFRRVSSVEIVDEREIPEKYMEVKTVSKPLKLMIRDAIRAGETVPGAAIKEELSMIIR